MWSDSDVIYQQTRLLDLTCYTISLNNSTSSLSIDAENIPQYMITFSEKACIRKYMVCYFL